MESEFREKALDILKKPWLFEGLPPHNEPIIFFRMWEYIWFQAHWSWSILFESDKCVVRRLVWDHATDMKAPFGKPSVYGAEAFISISEGEKMISNFKNLKFTPPQKPHQIGTDGNHLGVDYHSYNQGILLNWWCEAPKEWQTIQDWFNQTKYILEAALPKTTIMYR